MSVPLELSSPVFAKRSASLAGPQHDAFAWADSRAGASRAAYVLLALERHNARAGRSWREYCAVEAAEFVRAQCAGRREHLFLCEIVPADAPCRTYLDLELKFSDAGAHAKAKAAGYDGTWPPDVVALDAARDALLAALACELRERAALGDSVPIDYALSAAHKASKWSCHATLDVRAGPSALWRTNADCRACVLATRDRVAKSHPLTAAIVDDGVYSRNRIMRCCGSSKAAEPCRMLRPLAGELQDGPQRPCCNAPQTMAPATLTASLITLVRVASSALPDGAPVTSRVLPPTGASRCVWTTAHFLARNAHEVPLLVAAERAPATALLPSAPRASITRQPPSADGGLVERICAHKTFAPYGPARTFKESSDPRRFVLPCYGTRCDFAGSHSVGKTPVYLLLDMLRGRWTQRCHNARCAAALERRAPERVMTPALAKLCMAYMRDVWHGGSLVGGLARRLGVAVPPAHAAE